LRKLRNVTANFIFFAISVLLGRQTNPMGGGDSQG
jgi:hypothetical protein